jgi:hypothetical protein
MTMPEGRYVAKPQTVTAIQWTGDNAAEVKTWAGEIPDFDEVLAPTPVGSWLVRGDEPGTEQIFSPTSFSERYELAPSTEPEPTPVGVIADQPPPVPNDGPALWDLVLADMRERHQRYGTALQANNGRDMLIDAYQEILDLAVYLRGEIAERRTVVPRRGDAMEEWLKGFSDLYRFDDGPWSRCMGLLLDDYRVHADAGKPLDEPAGDPRPEEA